jgi:uncharacterized protein (DUF2384 family)
MTISKQQGRGGTRGARAAPTPRRKAKRVVHGEAARATGGAQAVGQDALRGGQLVTHFLDRKGGVVVDRVVKYFGMSKQQLAETIGVRAETLYRRSRVSAPKTQSRATEMLEIVGRLSDWAGGEKQAMAWYRAEPIPAFGGRTAEALVKEGKAAAVRDYLDHIATGGFA